MPKRKAADAVESRRPSRTSRRENMQDRENIPPTTPRKIAKTKGLPATPVSAKRTISLFTPTKRIGSTPMRSPSSTPSTPRNTIFTRAKAVLQRGSVPGKLAARSSERAEIQDFLSNQIETLKRGAFLYICGPPGTGKTALTNEVFSEYQECSSLQNASMAFINCMSFTKPEEVFERVIEAFKGKPGAVNTQLDALFIKRKTMSLLVLDEMDHLVTKNLDVLYKLLEYANRPGSKLVLIGIANSLNLPDRFLPRLKAKGLEPRQLSFNPYTTKQIVEIVTARLQSLDLDSSTKPLMDAKAIEFCARKVSAASGDLRMALDLCRRAIELVEMEHLKREEESTPLQEISLQPLTPSPSPKKRRRLLTLSETDKVLVTPAHINRATALGSAQSFQQRLQNLSTHQKAILCTLVVLKSSTPTPNLADVRDKYTKLCRRGGMLDPLPRGEFLDACELLDGMDVIAIQKAKSGKLDDKERMVGLGIQDMDVLQAIAGVEMLQKFLE